MRRQKKVPKEKATLVSVTPAEAGATCGARGMREAQKLASLKHLRLLIRLPLRSSAQTQGDPKFRRQKTEAHKDAPWRVLLELVFGSHAVMRRRVAQDWAEKGARMFERSEFARTPPRPSNAACPQGRRIRLAFLLGTLRWRSKEKYLGRRAETRLLSELTAL